MSGADLALRLAGSLLAALAAAAPELWDLLSPSEREAFDSIIARGQGHLPAAGAAHAAVAAIFATAPTAPASVPTPDVVARHKAAAVLVDMDSTLSRASALTAREREALRLAIATLRPPVGSLLAPPVIFDAPDSTED